jgi:hypothetical protein
VRRTSSPRFPSVGVLKWASALLVRTGIGGSTLSALVVVATPDRRSPPALVAALHGCRLFPRSSSLRTLTASALVPATPPRIPAAACPGHHARRHHPARCSRSMRMTVPIVARPLPSDGSPPSHSSLTCPPAAQSPSAIQPRTGRLRLCLPIIVSPKLLSLEPRKRPQVYMGNT